MPRARILLAAAVVGGGALLGPFTAVPAANASGCPDPDYPCDPMPYQPPSVPKPKVTFGCGTVTVTVGSTSKTFQVLPCPGPYI